MAIDTRNKRASILAFDGFWGQVYPNPDGSIATAPDREHNCEAYAGLAVTQGIGVSSRPSVLNQDVWWDFPLPNPDGSIKAPDRKQLLQAYATQGAGAAVLVSAAATMAASGFRRVPGLAAFNAQNSVVAATGQRGVQSTLASF